MTTEPHRLPTTPDSALGPTVRDTIVVGGRSFGVCRPDAVDRLLDDPELGASSAVEEYMPYWASLWSGALVLAEAVLQEPWKESHLHALEIGCGLGLPGLAALARGMRVTFSDYDATALRFAAESARFNGFTDFQCLPMDWRWPPGDLQVPVILAADVAYDVQMFKPLASLIRRVLAPGGVCLMANGNRVQVPLLADALTVESLYWTLERSSPSAAGGTVGLYRILRA